MDPKKVVKKQCAESESPALGRKRDGVSLLSGSIFNWSPVDLNQIASPRIYTYADIHIDENKSVYRWRQLADAREAFVIKNTFLQEAQRQRGT